MASETTLGTPVMSGARIAVAVSLALLCGAGQAASHYLIVGGLGGQPDYEAAFLRQALQLEQAARSSVTAADNVQLLVGEAATSDAIEAAFDRLAQRAGAADSVAVFLLGHGSYDGEQYKFNVPGRDLDGARFAELLAEISAGSVLIVNATSASGAVLEAWAGDGRTLITATRSGAERNATRFGEYWARALSSDAADLNKNGIVTAREAFDFAERSVADSFEEEDALATEHPQLAGDGAERFAAARLIARAVATPQQRDLTQQLEALEAEIAQLRLQRDSMPNDEYLNQLQGLLVQLATTRRELDAATAQESDDASTAAD